MIRILILSNEPDKAVFDNLGENIEPYYCASVMAATAIVEEINPRIVFIESKTRGAIDFLKWLKRETGSTAIVIQSDELSMDYFAWGADSTIGGPITIKILTDVLHEQSLMFDHSQEDSKDSLSDNEYTRKGFWDISEAFIEPKTSISNSKVLRNYNVQVVSQEVICIWGAQGGAGRTTLALLLAEALADFDVLLVDLCFKEGPGDINTLLELPISPHIGRLIDERQDRRKGFVECLIKPKYGRFAVIQPPPTIDQAENVSPDDVIELIDQARRMFQVVIIDLPDDLSPITLEAIDMSTSVLLLSTNHPGGMARLESIKSFIRKDISKLLVLNRFNENMNRAKDVAHFLDIPLGGVIGTISELEAYANGGRLIRLEHNVTDRAINDILKIIFGFGRGTKIHKRSFAGKILAGLASVER